MNKTNQKGKVKGTVLLTVVGVMMVMVVFLMSTLIMTTTAKRRSYYTYFETQAQYAAQAALDAVTHDAYSDDQFNQWMKSLPTEGGTITVNFDDSIIPVTTNAAGHKLVTCHVQRESNLNMVWDPSAHRVIGQQAWKITATASVGHGSNTAECVVANYIYATDNTFDGGSDSANQIKYEIASISREERPNGSIPTPIVNNATQNGATGLNVGYTNNLNTYGGSGGGFGEYPQGRTKYDGTGKASRSSNFEVSYGGFTRVGSTIYAATYKDYGLELGQGIVLYGNVYTENEFNVYAKSKMPATSVDYNNLPFIYIDGKLTNVSARLSIGAPNAIAKDNWSNLYQIDGASACPVNLYCGSITFDQKKNSYLYGDIYLYEPTETSKIIIDQQTKLVAFSSNVIQKSNMTAAGYVGGNIICNNKELEIEATDGCTIAGDIIMTNPSGTLKISVNNNNCTVKGTVVARNSISDNNGKLSVNGGIYAGTGRTTCGATGNVLDGQGTSYTNTDNAAYIDSLGIQVTNGSDYGDTVQKIFDAAKAKPGATSTGYYDATYTGSTLDYSLFPFTSRLDEIFEEYVRWDVRDASGKPGYDSASVAESVWKDDLIKESEKAGHKWSLVAKYSTTYHVRYFPATTPIKGRSFISKLETMDATTDKSIGIFPTSYNDMLAYLPNGKTDFDEFDRNAGTQSVKLYCHDTAGTKQEIDFTNAYVVNTNCKIEVKQGDKIFIDPTRGGHSEADPLIVCMYGDAGNATIVINNSAEYRTNYSSYKAYADYTAANSSEYNKPHASRSDVIIYFMADGQEPIGSEAFETDQWGNIQNDKLKPGYTFKLDQNGQKIWVNGLPLVERVGAGAQNGDPNTFAANAKLAKFVSSGAYYQIEHQKIDFVQNVIYPGESGYASLTAANKYKFELIPNNIIYAGAGTISFQQNSLVCGAIIAPNSKFWFGGQQDPLNIEIEYRLDYNSAKSKSSESGDMKNLNNIGSLFCKEISYTNMCNNIFGGKVDSIYTPGQNTQQVSTSSSSSANSNSGPNQGASGNNFANDHQGAN